MTIDADIAAIRDARELIASAEDAQTLEYSGTDDWISAAADAMSRLLDALDQAQHMASQRDCRTCRNYTTASGGCMSVLRCVDGAAYQQAGAYQFWKDTP